MSFEFTYTGLTIQTYQEIFDGLVAGYQAIYGPDIDVSADSPDGQRIGIGAKHPLDAQAFALSIYNQFDPDFSTGEMLNKIIKLSGISRNPASRSQADINVTTDRPVTLDEDYTIEDDLGQKWITGESVSLSTGVTSVTFVSEDFAKVEASADTITIPVTYVIGVVSVANPSAAVPGENEETDAELRIRRKSSTAAPATSTTGGLFAALGDLAGVSTLAIYENDTDTADVTLALDAHSLWCIIEGGEIDDIVETIAKNKTGGTGLKGSVSGTYVESIPLPNDELYLISHTMEFDRPVGASLYVTMTVKGNTGTVVDVDAIKAALSEKSFNIGESASASSLYKEVYSVGDTFVATLLEISDDDITYTDGTIASDPDGLFSIDIANITITDIT